MIGSPSLAEFALSVGARVLGFCDSALDDAALPSGVEQVTPTDRLDPVDVAWVRLPRTLDELDQWCAWVAASGATLVTGARTKHLSPSMNAVIARHFADVNASRGRDKSRVLHGTGPRPQAASRPGAAWPRWGVVDLPQSPGEPTAAARVAHHGGTFAGGRVDPGTALLLANLHLLTARPPERILDWGSGAGIITTALAGLLPRALIDAVDLSWAGAEATRLTVTANDVRAEVHWADGNRLLDSSDDYDLVISNPPFHAGVARDSSATEALIEIAAARLLPGGELWLVHNSHLPWLRLMRRHGFADVIAQDTGYTVSRLRC